MKSPTLETIAGQIGELADSLQGWLPQQHRWPLPPDARAALTQFVKNLSRQRLALLAERPYLVVMLMGGTGVGKSSLLNALAGGTVAEAAFTRPTTREPIIYVHERDDLARLDSQLSQCRVIRHRQPGLEHKILVDTPDLDSNVTSHRERLEAVLPQADVVLYVGSQEKYHDEAGWELFLKHRQQRAFAFVLNKWDRCLAEPPPFPPVYGGEQGGVRPDQDLLHDLAAAGFAQPLLFRTSARAWAESNGAAPAGLPPGEQFPALVQWLEQGLTKREIAAIHQQGVAHLLQEIEGILKANQPPDAQSAALETQEQWSKTIRAETKAQVQAFMPCVAVHQKRLERRIGAALAHPFGGVMGLYSRALDFFRFGFSSIRRSPPPTPDAAPDQAIVDDLGSLARDCTQEACRRSLTGRTAALTDRLVANADDAGLPVAGLADEVREKLTALTEAAYADSLMESLRSAELRLAGPDSWRQRLSKMWTWLGNTVPIGIALIVFAWQLYAKFFGHGMVSVTDIILLPVIVALLTMTILYVIYRRTVIISWKKLAPWCEAELGRRLEARLDSALIGLPRKQAELLEKERSQVSRFLEQAQAAAKAIRLQEEFASVAVLYSR